MKKFLTGKIILIIVAILAIGLYYFSRSSNSPSSLLSLAKTYTNADFGFSINYPEGYAASSFADGAPDPDTGEPGTTILVQNASTTKGFQIYISAFNEPDTVLTKERILKDLPDLSILNEQRVKIGGNISGLSFQSKTDAGQERDVWFVYKNHLYQVSAPQDSENILLQSLATLKFSP